MTSISEQNSVVQLAFASDDGETISQHFGKARQYAVVTIEKGAITARELRPKFSPHSESGEHNAEELDHNQRHQLMVDSIKDCQIVIAGGMGMGAQMHFQRAGLSVLMTELTSIDEACQAYINGELKHIPERLHQSHRH
jgi:predicted Fe-Mo cluster-binding NifX family protein